jgi:aspartyl-tRNA(Asn)/glutamyl-tRNA(Gln) amidotransferase subunit B
MAKIVGTALKVGLEVHVELSTRSKMFSRAPSPACVAHDGAEPNTCLDEVVLGLPGALPVINREAVAMSIRVGLALGCSIAPVTRWDRKSYFYPDMPKNYQISQYDLPLCFDGSFELASGGAEGGEVGGAGGGVKRIGIIRAHLEEDAGKLLHEAPGGGELDYSIVDLNRAGTALLEIVTQPDFTSAAEVEAFCRELRALCRWLGVTEGVMQKGHMRFEPNINCVLTLDDGRVVRTPIVEVKNLNSFKAVRGAIEFEAREQPRRWEGDGKEMGPGSKSTRGWDDVGQRTVLQREKEDAHDYRYFPDPDLLPLAVPREWVESLRAELPESPAERRRRYAGEYGLSRGDVAQLAEEPGAGRLFEAARRSAEALGVPTIKAAKAAANLILQQGGKRANERGVGVHELGIHAEQIAGLIRLREDGAINSNAVDELFGVLCESGAKGAEGSVDVAALAQARGLILDRDDSVIDAWCEAAIAQQPQAAADVRAGKDAALGRLVGAAMKAAAGRGDASAIRARLLAKLGRG